MKPNLITSQGVWQTHKFSSISINQSSFTSAHFLYNAGLQYGALPLKQLTLPTLMNTYLQLKKRHVGYYQKPKCIEGFGLGNKNS